MQYILCLVDCLKEYDPESILKAENLFYNFLGRRNGGTLNDLPYVEYIAYACNKVITSVQ